MRLSKIIPEAVVSMKYRKGKQYSGVIFGEWDDKEGLRSSTWSESETVRRLINFYGTRKLKYFPITRMFSQFCKSVAEKRIYRNVT